MKRWEDRGVEKNTSKTNDFQSNITRFAVKPAHLKENITQMGSFSPGRVNIKRYVQLPLFQKIIPEHFHWFDLWRDEGFLFLLCLGPVLWLSLSFLQLEACWKSPRLKLSHPTWDGTPLPSHSTTQKAMEGMNIHPLTIKEKPFTPRVLPCSLRVFVFLLGGVGGRESEKESQQKYIPISHPSRCILSYC